MKKIDLFPTTIYTDHIVSYETLAKAKNLAREMQQQNGYYNTASIRLGWQSSKDIYVQPVFAVLAENVLRYVKTNITNHMVFISSMWVNVHEKHGFNHVHVHRQAWLSGVIYLDCNEQSGKLRFCDPRPAADYADPITESIYEYQPVIGDMFLFPGYLPHLVEPNLSDEPRISVSFNIELVQNCVSVPNNLR